MTRMTSVVIVARGMGNVASVHVVGSKGSFTGVRKNLELGLATARKYAQLLDAPHRVI